MKRGSIKKTISTVVALGVSLSLVGCSSGSSSVTTTQKNNNAASSKTSTATFGNKIVQIQSPPMTSLDNSVWAG